MHQDKNNNNNTALTTVRDVTLIISSIIVSISSIAYIGLQYNNNKQQHSNKHFIKKLKFDKQQHYSTTVHNSNDNTTQLSSHNNNDNNNLEVDTLLTKHRQLPFGIEYSMTPAIITSSTYSLRDTTSTHRLGQHNDLYNPNPAGYFYSRWGNPTVHLTSSIIADIENAKGSILFASGMSAITSTFLAILQANKHCICSKSVYSGTHEFIQHYSKRYQMEFTCIDTTNIDNIKQSIQHNTVLIYIETPANPTMSLTNIRQIRQLLIEIKRTDIYIAVDGTFASPYHIRNLELGADISIHSCTKYLNGHSDVTAGVVSSNNVDLLNKITHVRTIFGGNLSAYDSYNLQRGLKTLSVRMQKHSYNALQIAKYLESHELIQNVYYPGLASHKQHTLAKEIYQHGYSGMLSFELMNDINDDTIAVQAGAVLVDNLKLITLAVSLGSVESLIVPPASTTHSMLTKQQRLEAGLTEGLVRFSVGIEDVNDLISDLDTALNIVKIQVYDKNNINLSK